LRYSDLYSAAVVLADLPAARDSSFWGSGSRSARTRVKGCHRQNALDTVRHQVIPHHMRKSIPCVRRGSVPVLSGFSGWWLLWLSSLLFRFWVLVLVRLVRPSLVVPAARGCGVRCTGPLVLSARGARWRWRCLLRPRPRSRWLRCGSTSHTCGCAFGAGVAAGFSACGVSRCPPSPAGSLGCGVRGSGPFFCSPRADGLGMTRVSNSLHSEPLAYSLEPAHPLEPQ
jgi:hypothetical protein